MSEQTQELDRTQLKIMAYQQKVAELQDLNTDLRVELTVKEQELGEARAELAALKGTDEKEEAVVPDGIDAD